MFQLKEFLRKQNLPLGGKKKALIERIKAFLDQENNDNSILSESCNATDDSNDGGSVDSDSSSDGSSKSCSDDGSYRSVDSDSGSDGSSKRCSDDGSYRSKDSDSGSNNSSNNSSNGSDIDYSSGNSSSDDSSGNNISEGDTNLNTQRVQKKKDVKTTEVIHNKKNQIQWFTLLHLLSTSKPTQ